MFANRTRPFTALALAASLWLLTGSSDVFAAGPTTGYNILTSFGGIYSFGSATYYGNLIDHGYPGPAVGLAEMPDGTGYSILNTGGGIYTFGSARYYGNLIDHGYPGPATALAMTPTGNGYAILTASGGLYTFGDAQYFGNLIDHGYPGPAVSVAYTPSGHGYNILTSFGAIYSFGDALYFGNLLDHGYPGPAASLAYTSTGLGYSILTTFGGIYSFGDAHYYGNLIDHCYPGPAVALSNTTGTAGPVLYCKPRAPLPLRLRIPSIGVNAQVESVGTDSQGFMGVPSNSAHVAWYNVLSRPGEVGDAVMTGHVDWYDTSCAVFCYLSSIRVGDQAAVDRADGSTVTYAVDRIDYYPAGQAPDWIFQSDGPPRLTLITCAGDYVPGYGYTRRMVVSSHII